MPDQTPGARLDHDHSGSTFCRECFDEGEVQSFSIPTDQTPEARLAAALHGANVECDYSREFDLKSCAAGDGPHSITARAILATDPTLARHLALGAAVERLDALGTWRVEFDYFGTYIVTIDQTNGHGEADTLTAAITEALGDD